MKMMNNLIGILAGSLLMTFGLANDPALASGVAGQDQSAQPAASKKSSTTEKKSNRRELSEDQGGARGFALPGDQSTSKPPAKTQAKSTKASSKKTTKTAPDHAPKQQP